MTPLQDFTADHRYLRDAAAAAAGIVDPVAVDPDCFETPLLEKSVRGELVPIDGVLIRDWFRSWRKTWPGVEFGARVYHIDDIRFARVSTKVNENITSDGYCFFLVGRADYIRFYRLAVACKKAVKRPEPPPILADTLFIALRQNSFNFLNSNNLARIRALGGRPKRGLLFSGPPGNGKTSACRWILQRCGELGIETKQVSPDDYRAARERARNPAAAVRELFKVSSRGVIFFDDMDLALRDRNDFERPEDQAVFLGAMDGIDTNEGVVYVFTTNLPLNRIDPAFKRPGRLDLALNFPKPDATLRRRLVERWHADIRAALDCEQIVRDTEGQSFAEIEELKNLLVLRFIDAAEWNWGWAREQFDRNRQEALKEKSVPLGFAATPLQLAPAFSV